MKQAVLMSIQPQWCELIARGEKTVEIRKTIPKLGEPFTCYIYCTRGVLSYPVGNGMVCHNNGGMVVIGEFTCDRITPLFNVCTDAWDRLLGDTHQWHKQLVERACLTEEELKAYARGRICYAWHISNLKLYEKPKRLNEFFYLRNAYVKRPVGITKELFPVERPPQSWCYVREE